MEGAPRVAAPIHPLGTLDGITMLLITVEAWPDSVVVRVAGLPNERTASLEAEYRRAIEAWAAARGEGGPTRPPREPGAAALGRLGLTIRDDLGTPYRVAAGSTGGTGSEWRGEWVFRPGPPSAVTDLIVDAPGVAHQGGVSVPLPSILVRNGCDGSHS
jgi:hypothetical protein